jgi:hypothetical protein
MRILAALLSMLFALSAAAAEMWRWKDADGVVHYSDRPVQGAEQINVTATQRSTGAIRPPPAPAAPPPPPVASYTRCEVASPTNDQVFNNTSTVNVSVAVDPALQPGHQVQVFLNGSVYVGWPPAQLGYTMQNVYRGSYTLSVRILDFNGRPLCSGSTVNFHVRQASLLSPARRPAGG